MSTPATSNEQMPSFPAPLRALMAFLVKGWVLATIVVAAVLAITLSGYYVVTSKEAFGGDSGQRMLWFSIATVFLALFLVILRSLSSMWTERRTGLVGNYLRNRLMLMFGLIATLPTVFVAGFTLFFLERGLENWFSDEINNQNILRHRGL